MGVGKRLCEKGQAVAPCESSVTRNESIVSEKWTAEEWLDFEGVGGDAERWLIGQPNSRQSATTESEYVARADFHKGMFSFERTGMRVPNAFWCDDLEQRI